MSDAFDNMDRMYRVQRYFYDFTRKYYLLGRDQLLTEMDVQPGENVLEVGCGTGRNLIILARRHPDARLYGLDASTAMLETAGSKIDGARINNIGLKTALADDFAYDKTFGLHEKFDKIFFSYSISMIPPWRESIDSALANLKPGGRLYIVDFFDQGTWPRAFRAVLGSWLAQFSVQYPSGLRAYLLELENAGIGESDFRPLYRGYCFISDFRKSDQTPKHRPDDT